MLLIFINTRENDDDDDDDAEIDGIRIDEFYFLSVKRIENIMKIYEFSEDQIFTYFN